MNDIFPKQIIYLFLRFTSMYFVIFVVKIQCNILHLFGFILKS